MCYLFILIFLIIGKVNQRLADFSRIFKEEKTHTKRTQRQAQKKAFKKKPQKPKINFFKIPDYFSYDTCTSLGFLNQQTEEKLPCHQNAKIYSSHEEQIHGAIGLNLNSLCGREHALAV